MMDKDALLAEMIENWQALTRAMDGVPHEEIEIAQASDELTVKELCAYLTAWDGEALRRIDVASGNRIDVLSNLHDADYWDAWASRQVEIKRIMAVQGILVDMVGTRQRLISRVAELSDFHFARWLAEDPQALQPYYATCLMQIQAWRTNWDIHNPPLSGVKKMLQNLRNRLGKH